MTQEEAWLLKEKYHGKKTEGFFADCARLQNGEPLAYIIGYTPFLHTKIFLDSHPLIPRPETEYWVEKVISNIKNRRGLTPTILDLCAGSGCIGVAVLASLPDVHVDFVEKDIQLHAIIQKNIVENHIHASRAIICGGDLFQHITQTYDYILSNPPYIDPKIDRTSLSVRTFEPHEALYGGKGGTDILGRIIKEAPTFLNTQGVLVLEHEPEQTDFIQKYGASYGFAITTHPDQYGTLRYSRLMKKV